MDLNEAIKIIGRFAHLLEEAFKSQFGSNHLDSEGFGEINEALTFLADLEKTGIIEVIEVFDPKKKKPEVNEEMVSEVVHLYFSNGYMEKVRWLEDKQCWVDTYGETHSPKNDTKNFFVKAWAKIPDV